MTKEKFEHEVNRQLEECKAELTAYGNSNNWRHVGRGTYRIQITLPPPVVRDWPHTIELPFNPAKPEHKEYLDKRVKRVLEREGKLIALKANIEDSYKELQEYILLREKFNCVYIPDYRD